MAWLALYGGGGGWGLQLVLRSVTCSVFHVVYTDVICWAWFWLDWIGLALIDWLVMGCDLR